MSARILVGDVMDGLASLADESVRCCVTSPPYWGLRDYGTPEQIGRESTPREYVATMLKVFREVRRILADDGTLWLNLGDSYASGGRGGGQVGERGDKQRRNSGAVRGRKTAPDGLKPKDLVGIPWRVAFALQDDGWWLREDIIWHKTNGMPESVRDRCTRSHEYVFHLTKSSSYYHNAAAIAEPATCPDPRMVDGFVPKSINGKHAAGPQSSAVRKSDKQRGHSRRHAGFNERWDAMERADQCSGMRNARSVWPMSTAPYRGAHFATFPPSLPDKCIRAGTEPGDTVLDPFMGAGTTGLVAARLGRMFVGVEINPEYAEMARARLEADAPLLSDITVVAVPIRDVLVT